MADFQLDDGKENYKFLLTGWIQEGLTSET